MKYTEPGAYKIQYTAEDGCGKTTVEDRTVIVEAPPRTVLYTDGTFIINELGEDRARNVALHGVATDEYIPFDPNGETDNEKYIFTNANSVLWSGKRSSIQRVEIGSNISPTNTSYWFYGCSIMTNADLSKLDTSNVTKMTGMFMNCSKVETLDLSNFNTGMLTNMDNMFNGAGFTSINLSSFDTSRVTSFARMFMNCSKLETLDLSNFNTTGVRSKMNELFGYCYVLKSLDISGFNTSGITEMLGMFRQCRMLETIYVSQDFTVSAVYSSNNMFENCASLVGGAGTVWSSSNPIDKTYAHIDGGTSNPGYFTLKEE